MSIKARLVITISLVIALVFGTIGVVIVNATENRMIARVDAGLQAAPILPPRQQEGERRASFEGGRRETATLLVDANGNQRLAEPAGYAEDPDPLPAISLEDLTEHSGEIYTTGSVDGSDRNYRVLVHPLQGGFLLQAAPLDNVEATVRSLIRIVTWSGIFVLVVVTGAVWFTVQRGLRPIDDMVETADLIAGGDLSHRIDRADNATEVGRLGHALNTMLGQIETSFAAKEASEQRLRRFIADASHELRTPLTSIRGYAELFRSGAAADPETLERVMLRIEAEGTRMSVLVEDLLLLARLDQGRPLTREPVDLVPLISDTVMDARTIDPDRIITFEHPDNAIVLGDADRLQQVAANLLTNARVHTPPGTPFHVRVDVDDSMVQFSVRDEGQGIAADDAERVFDRFFRVDSSRARTSGGTGLGLSIVASIVEAHGGHVTLDTREGQGTCVTVSLTRVTDDNLDTFSPLGSAITRV